MIGSPTDARGCPARQHAPRTLASVEALEQHGVDAQSFVWRASIWSTPSRLDERAAHYQARSGLGGHAQLYGWCPMIGAHMNQWPELRSVLGRAVRDSDARKRIVWAGATR